MDKPVTDLPHPRFVSLKYFCVDMMGYASSVSYYNHMKEPGWPQRLWVAGRPMLLYEECLTYQQGIIATRAPVEPGKPTKRKKMPPKKKGRTGRPVKAMKRPSPAP